MRLAPLATLLILTATLGCSRYTPREHSFYYWKTYFSIEDTTSQRMIRQMGIAHFYLHYMDIDWSENLGTPIPVGELSHSGPIPSSYTPVVFITNRTFERMPDEWIDILATRLTKKIKDKSTSIEDNAAETYVNSLSIKYNENYQHVIDSAKGAFLATRKNPAPEIQIDCDWTASTKDKYFRFLKKMKELNPGKTFSTTVRLYPYKYPDKMGVPPVDKAMLMCYNLGNIKSSATANSIFDYDEMNKYLNASTYPLALDIALPIFSWQVWFRGGQFKGIIHNMILPDSGNTAFTMLAPSRIRFNTDTIINNEYYREGDELRTEMPDEKQLVKAADKLARKINKYQRLAFFDWDNRSIAKYEATIQKIFSEH